MMHIRFQRGLDVLRRSVAPMLLFSGVAILGYSAVQYGAMIVEQRRLQSIWSEQQNAGPVLAQHSLAHVDAGGLTRISMPSIGLSAVVVEGTDLLSMMIGPGHLTGSAEPGEPGNSVISAHRDTFFRHVRELAPGDQIWAERNGKRYIYAVEGFRIVEPDDTSVAAPTNDDRLTLITCDPAYYLGPAPKRLVIVSKLVAPAPALADHVETAKQKRPRLRVHEVKASRAAAE